MHSLLIPFPVPPWHADATELRIDVDLDHSGIDKELKALHARLHRLGDPLYNLSILLINYRGLTFRYREADGEHYVYVEDRQHGCLAGYVVFNRLIELDRRADPFLRAPHARFALAYQRLGIAGVIYRWWLDAGNCLLSGARQSTGANALWHKLSSHYPLAYVDLRNKRLSYLDRQVSVTRRQDLHTRMLMLGRGCSLEQLAGQTGMLDAEELTLKPLPVAIAAFANWVKQRVGGG
ncbi:MAG: hypothetical protein KGL40_10615 [Rhodocyclaceae bacterium]|nr:hypothetical protein [Rhodocyclaceae bacterium]